MIYICIPTHNEQQTVGVVLWKLRQVLTDFPRDYQLLVADDASTDKTAEVLEPYTRVLPLTVIRSERQQGTAASLEMLLREAVRRSEYPKRDVIVTLQADFSEEPDDMVPLVKRLEAGADVAIGNKISSSRETRSRRFARSLARFFMRRQKWPEGVATPFDGFRAYRLYAVKRALEERAGKRLIRFDGWAGNAELLRAVLPHARRVDAVDIHDRPDRLQRPRREKPFAAAMQVRVLSAGTEPAALVGVEDLERIAQTASRGRERAAITADSIKSDRGMTRSNGARTRQVGRREQGRSRGQSSGATRAGGSETTRRERPSGDARAARSEGRPKGDRQPRAKQAEPRRRQPRRSEEAGAGSVTAVSEAASTEATPEELLAQSEAGIADEATKPKRKRRRRKRGGKGRSGATAGEASADGQDSGEPDRDEPVSTNAVPGVPDAGVGSRRSDVATSRSNSEPPDRPTGDVDGEGESGDAGGGIDAEGAAPKKRRRRGGRRGGRGRKRPRPEGESVSGESASGEAASGEAVERPEPAPEPVSGSNND